MLNIDMNMSKAEFELIMTLLLTSEITVAKIAPFILEYFGQTLVRSNVVVWYHFKVLQEVLGFFIVLQTSQMR